MSIELTWLNCFWLILPLLAWNLVLGARITDPRVTSDAHSPRWLLIAENIARIPVFALPLLLPLQWGEPWSIAGLVVYLMGTLVYFASWRPLLQTPTSTRIGVIALFAPRLTPFLSFLGIALIAHSWLYGVLAAVFIGLHTYHGIQNLSPKY
jgi:hypothetical protein